MEIISEKVLSQLNFTDEPLSQWGNNTDLLKFLYVLHDKETIMITPFGEKSLRKIPKEYTLTLYNDGIACFHFLAERFINSAQNNLPARRSVKKEIKAPNFKDCPLFGKIAKYCIAWKAVTRWVKSESAFFSIDHLLESEDEIECSINLACSLYYKQAIQLLRSFLEEDRNPVHSRFGKSRSV